jgi:hypothetical protein
MANRLLTINIRNYLVGQPRRKRVMRISRYIKERINQHTNVGMDNIKISSELNSIILKQHLHSMKKLKVNINVEKEKAMVTPFSDKPKPQAVAQKGDAKAKPEAKKEVHQKPKEEKAAKPKPDAPTPKN